MIDYYLFDGIKNNDNGKSLLYDKMLKGDYFFTSLLHYLKGIKRIDRKSETREKTTAYFGQTPSDKPNNFAYVVPRLNNDNLWIYDEEQKTAYLKEIKDKIQSHLFKYKNNVEAELFKNFDIFKKVRYDEVTGERIGEPKEVNRIDFDEFYDLITGVKTSTSISGKKPKINGEMVIFFLYGINMEIHIL